MLSPLPLLRVAIYLAIYYDTRQTANTPAPWHLCLQSSHSVDDEIHGYGQEAHRYQRGGTPSATRRLPCRPFGAYPAGAVAHGVLACCWRSRRRGRGASSGEAKEGLRFRCILALCAPTFFVPQPPVLFDGGYAGEHHPQVLKRHTDLAYLFARVQDV